MGTWLEKLIILIKFYSAEKSVQLNICMEKVNFHVSKLNKSNLTSSKYWYETTYKQDGNGNKVIGGGANLLHPIFVRTD